MATKGMGWVPDYPDIRDCRLSSDRIQKNQQKIQGLDTGDRTNSRIEKLTAILKELAPLLQNQTGDSASLLETLDHEIQNEAIHKINFLPAAIDEKILMLGNQGEDVRVLQKNLRRLGYYSSEPTGYFDHFTEQSVQEFQKQQKLLPNGILNSVTRAELAALSSIGERILNRDSYVKGDWGPGILYTQLQLQTLGYEVAVTGKFDDLTEQAVKAFQHQELNQDLSLGLGKIGPKTRSTLTEKLKNEQNISPQFHASPIRLQLFEKCTGLILDVLKGDRGNDCLIEEFGGFVDIQKYLGRTHFNEKSSDDEKCRVLKERIAPLVEVIVRMTDILGGQFDAESDLIKAYKTLNQIPAEIIPNFEETARLKGMSDYLENGKGYVSSRVLQRHKIYNKGNSEPAVIFLQYRLKALGFYHGPAVGYFENTTEEAVKKFQKSRNLVADSSVGPDTINALTKIVDDSFEFLETSIPDEITQAVIKKLNVCDLELIEDTFEFGYCDQGDIHSHVETLQKALCLLDFLNQENITGTFCSTTEAAVKRFQSSQGLKVDGIAGKQTNEALVRSLSEYPPKRLEQELKPIITVIAQIISPIGSHTELEKAAIAGFNTFIVIAQVIKLEQALEQIKNNSSYSTENLESWYRRFQIFMRNNRVTATAVTLTNTALVDEFKPVILTLVDTFKSRLSRTNCSAIHQRITLKVLEVVIQEVYKDLLSDLEDFQHELKDNQIVTSVTQSIVNFIIDSIKVDNLIKLDQSHVHLLKQAASDRTFINVRDVTSPSPDCRLQIPVSGNLHKQILSNLKKSNVYVALPQFVDLSIWCSPIEDQGSINSCTAHAGVALIEYFEKRSFGTAIDASRRFLYQVTRNLMHRQGDSGASVRETMKAMVLFGVPPEEYCPYTEDNFDEDPSSFCYAFAQNYQAITYFRLDDPGISPEELLAQIKTVLVAGFPCMFGFTLYDSIHDSSNLPGHIPFPGLRDKREGGHAVVAVGYDDYKHIKNAPSSGAFLVKNSWGIKWGNKGYGWLPYDYVLNGLARDWWSLIKAEWTETGNFGLGSSFYWMTDLGEKIGRND
ncbi:peptidoglycan-binding protein [Oscillatoria sp. FACHB-1407]|uniref:peptidoglycan-binding protein n=1 Tax=Oscillatoria sp. FACHB-1407 TaxID=2692847 RepID=UPI001685181B|nr:peptidoglycan-binding protein [Oscillatoria sp. FACHB-1407]MBD2462839.1 peptidoglycan-binding protein [Oscillatoria sp. FACHB-1407]